jgi:hypothetical protein
MSRYRKTFREAMAEVELNEVGYLQPRLNDKQIANIKNVWKHKTKKDITPAVKKMIANMDVPTQLAIKHAKINQLSDLVEGKMKDIFTMDKEGKSAAEIAKYLKLDVKTVKGILGEQDSAQDMQDVKKADKIKEDEDKELDQEFLDDVASNTPNEEQFEEEKKKKTDVAPEHDSNTGEEKSENSKEKLEKEVEKKDQEIAALKQKAETDKAKAIKKDTEKMVNPETGEPLLQIGLAYKHMRDKMKKEMQKEEVISEAGISPAMIATLKKEYEPFRGKRISAARAQQLMNILNKFKDSDLQKLSKENIPFISTGAKSKLVVRGMKFTVKDIKPFGEDLDEEMFEACWTGYKQVGMKNKGGKQVPNCVPEELNKDDEKVIKKVKDMLKGASDKHAAQAKMIDKALKTEMKKDDAYAIGMAQAKKVMNDEPPLQKKTIKKGHEIADKILNKEAIDPFMISYSKYGKHAGFEGGKTLQDIQKKAQELRKKGFTIDKMGRYNPPTKKENAPSVADIDRLKKQGMKPKMKNEDHPAREVYESIAAVRKKAEKSGMPYGVLKKVYDRGMAAWRGGHRPGATQVQWALARVNSFVTKSSGTWGGADKDLAKQVRGK